MTEAEALEVKAHADAALKLAFTALEFMQNLAASQGKRLDFMGSADALLNSPVVDNVDAQVFAIEKRSRELAAGVLMRLANGSNQV